MSNVKKFEQYYTNPKVIYKSIDKIKEKIKGWNNHYWIDFSAGNNFFLKTLKPKHSAAFDLDPQDSKVKTMNWFDVKRSMIHLPKNVEKFIIVYNPPYGKSGNIAKKFIKHGIKEFDPEYFILVIPYTTKSVLFEGYNIIYECDLPDNSFYTPDGKPFKFNSFLFIFEKAKRRKSPPKKTDYSDVWEYKKVSGPRMQHPSEPYDMIISSKGNGTIFRNIFYNPNKSMTKWDYYRDGQLVSKQISDWAGYKVLSNGGTYIWIKFSKNYGKAKQLKVIKNLHKNVPKEAYYRTPASVDEELLYKALKNTQK